MEGIVTPLGTVGLRLDGRPCAHDGSWEVVSTSDYARRHPVDGNWRVAYWHEPDGAPHVLECSLDPSRPCEGATEGGERLEATEVDDGNTVLVIAVEYDFEEHAHGHGRLEYDYTATADGLVATVELPADARAQWVVFGVSWVSGYDEGSRTNPWLVGDPGGDRDRLPVGVYEKGGSGPYGDRTIEWFLPIDRPWERKDDVLALLGGLELIEHTGSDEGYGALEDVETVVEVPNPHGGDGIWLGFGGDFTLGFGGTHWHYGAYEGDYQRLKSDVGAILSGGLRVVRAHAGEGRWKGTEIVEGELASEADGWAVLRSMGLGPEHERRYAELGSTVEVVSWLPERCLRLRVGPGA